MSRVELLAPAGSLEKLRIAFLYGADAVYLGGRDYSMRANAKNFSLEEIKEACTIAHRLGKKVYVTVNIVFHNEDYEGLIEYLKALEEYQVDAVIVSDMALIDLIHENQLQIPIHISTQMSNANYESVMYLKNEGVERVVLARESSKENIQEIIEKTGTKNSPWYIVPADQKWYARYVVSEVVIKVLEDCNPKYPKLPEEERDMLSECRKLLEEE